MKIPLNRHSRTKTGIKIHKEHGELSLNKETERSLIFMPYMCFLTVAGLFFFLIIVMIYNIDGIYLTLVITQSIFH